MANKPVADEPKVLKVTYLITGKPNTSMLMNYPESLLNPPIIPPGGTTRKKEFPSKEDDAESRTYRCKDGRLFIPSNWFYAAVAKHACVNRKIGKFSAKALFKAGVTPTEAECPLFDPKTNKPITEYRIQTDRVVVHGQGVPRHRPAFDEWACYLVWDINTQDIAVESVTELLQTAGRMAGVGDWRPSAPKSPGPHGRFDVKVHTIA